MNCTGLLCISLGILFLYLYTQSSPHYIRETITFFSQANTPWLSKDQLAQLRHSQTYTEYVQATEQMAVADLIKDMLIGQPLKYIWRDRNNAHLQQYLRALSSSSLSYCDSLTGHSSLYTSNLGTWSEASNLIYSLCSSSNERKSGFR